MTLATIPQKIERKDLKPDENLCDYCTAKCCKYFALPIETPSSWAEFEYFRWYLLHQRTTIFIDEDNWYLMVHTECKHLLPDNRCGIYETRPDICQEYSTKNCEFDDDWTYDRYFESPEQIFEYAEATLGPRRGMTFRSRQPPMLPILG